MVLSCFEKKKLLAHEIEAKRTHLQCLIASARAPVLDILLLLTSRSLRLLQVSIMSVIAFIAESPVILFPDISILETGE